MPNEVKLLPCAHCGSDNLITCVDGSMGSIICRNCCVEMPYMSLDDPQSERWNTRPTTLVTDEVVERVARALFECWDARVGSPLDWNEESQEAQDAWRDQARAALASMPTVVTGEQPQDLGDHALPPSGLSRDASQAKPAATIAKGEKA